MKFIENKQKLKALRQGTAYRGVRIFLDVLLGLEVFGAAFYVYQSPLSEPWEWRLALAVASVIGGVLFRCLAVICIDAVDALLERVKNE